MPSSAGPLDALFRHELSPAVVTVVCETHLVLNVADETPRAVADLAQFRERVLGVARAAPVTHPRLSVTAPPSPDQQRALGEHLRSIEAWSENMVARTYDLDDVDPGELVRAERRALAVALKPGPLDPAHDPPAFWRNGYAAALITLACLRPGLWVLPALIGLDPVASLGWRLGDRERARADAAARGFLARGPGDQRVRWQFTSRAYRIPRRVVDALWAGDPDHLVRTLGEERRESAWHLARLGTLPRELAHGRGFTSWRDERASAVVHVDDLYRRDADGVPRLTRVIRAAGASIARAPVNVGAPE